MQRILRRHIVRRAVLCLAVLGTLVAASVGLAPSAHALATAPSVAATRSFLPGGYEVFAVGGGGFTPYAPVSIEVINTATGAVIATVTVQAASTPVNTPASTVALVCNGLVVGFFGQPLQPTVPMIGIFPALGLNCQLATVQLGFVTTGVTGTIATTFALPLSTTAVTIVAVDSATGMASNRVALTA